MTRRTFDKQLLDFLENLKFEGRLPKNISVMNPFADEHVMPVVRKFYNKYYNDHHNRNLILGINPGRLGAGATGIPFTDTKRLESQCGIVLDGMKTHEPSSVFIYNVIDAFGGPEKFYKEFYISSVCPLGFVSMKNGKQVNYNYYDSRELQSAVRPYAISKLKEQLGFGIKRDKCFVLGTGKNFAFVQDLNDEFQFFEHVIPLEHPRFIMQYKSKSLQQYIDKYIIGLTSTDKE